MIGKLFVMSDIRSHSMMHKALGVSVYTDQETGSTTYSDVDPVLYNLYRGEYESHSDRLLQDFLDRGLDKEDSKCRCPDYLDHLKSERNSDWGSPHKTGPLPMTVRYNLYKRI